MKRIGTKLLISAVGCVALISALVLALRPSEPGRAPDIKTMKIRAEFRVHSAPQYWSTDHITITYPDPLRVDESSIVAVSLDSYGPSNEKILPPGYSVSQVPAFNKLKRDLTLTLSAAAFSISPSGTITKSPGSTLPLQWTWSISPTKAGTQRLVLDMSDFRLPWYHESAAYASYIAGTNLEIQSDGVKQNGFTFEDLNTLPLSVNVTTQEGLSSRAYLTIRYALAFLGFILLYPAISDLVNRTLLKRKA